jgi:hypothetical protein
LENASNDITTIMTLLVYNEHSEAVREREGTGMRAWNITIPEWGGHLLLSCFDTIFWRLINLINAKHVLRRNFKHYVLLNTVPNAIIPFTQRLPYNTWRSLSGDLEPTSHLASNTCLM